MKGSIVRVPNPLQASARTSPHMVRVETAALPLIPGAAGRVSRLRRLLLLAGVGGLLLAWAAPGLPYAWGVGLAALARGRWEQAGPRHYTLIVTQTCVCPAAGEYRLTVRNGRVTAVETLKSVFAPRPPTPAEFAPLTAESMLRRARLAAGQSWGAPLTATLGLTYDAVTGYVTRFESDANGWLALGLGWTADTHYVYTARDLRRLDP